MLYSHNQYQSNGTYTNANTKHISRNRRTLLFRYERFINFLTAVLQHAERDTILTILTLSQRTAPLVVFKISVGRDPKILTAAATVENSILYAPMAENSAVCLYGPMSSFKSLFQNPPILQTISSGHDVIHTPAPFTVWGLLWHWWLSYPLRASIKLYPMTMPWTKRLE